MSRGVASLRSLARLLLAQISVPDLQRARARSFGHAKRRARTTAAIEENRPPPAAKRPVGLNSRMKVGGKTGGKTGGGGGKDESGGGTGTPIKDDGAGDASANVANASPRDVGQQESAEVEPPGSANRLLQVGDRTRSGKQTVPSSLTNSCPNTCLACRRVVLGHPLDAISYRCGGSVAVRNRKGGHDQIADAAPEVARTAGTGSFAVAPVPVADETYPVKHAGLGDQLKPAAEAGSSGAFSAGGRRGKRKGGCVGAAAVSEVGVWCLFHRGWGGPLPGKRTIAPRLPPYECGTTEIGLTLVEEKSGVFLREGADTGATLEGGA